MWIILKIVKTKNICWDVRSSQRSVCTHFNDEYDGCTCISSLLLTHSQEIGNLSPLFSLSLICSCYIEDNLSSRLGVVKSYHAIYIKKKIITKMYHFFKSNLSK